VLGEGPQLGELEALAASLGIADRVQFLGFRANPFALFARASVFILSSRYEGFGNVLAEALACGTPIVSTDCESGPAEILGGGDYGRLVPVGDDAAMAVAIEQSLTDPIDPAKLKTRSKSFTVDVAAAQYMALYDKVLGKPG
jgi:glycosyltransferase involved in cell wall biosynthesis